MSVDLNQIRLALHIATHGSQPQAAVALGIDQATIALQLNALEDEYGERLFHRAARGMTLTDFGTAIVPRLRWLLDEADRIENEIKHEARLISGDVRIAMPPILSSHLIGPLVAQVHENYERVRLHMFEGPNGQLEEWLANGTIDIAILYRYGQSHSPTERVIGSNNVHLIGRADAPLLQRGSISLHDLDGVPLVLPNAPSALRGLLTDSARREGITLNVIAEADSISIQKTLARAGQAFAVMGALAVTKEERELAAVPIVNPAINRSAVLTTSSRRPVTAAIRTILTLLEELAAPVLGG